MDEQMLNKTLGITKAPAPDENRRKQALAAGLAAFDANFENSAQGDEDEERLTDMEQQHARRFFMNKPRYLSGPIGAVALCALVAVLGAPFYLHESDLLIGKSKYKGLVSTPSMSVKTVTGAQVADADYQKRISQQNSENAANAIKNNSSAMPMPLGKSSSDTLAVPPPVAQTGDPLQEWRAKAEARRLSLESAPQPRRDELKAAPAEKAVGAPSNAPGIYAAPEASRQAAVAGCIQAKESEAAQAAGGASVDMLKKDSPVADKAIAMPVQPPAPGVMPAPSVPQVMPVSPPMDYRASYYQEANRDAFPDFKDNGVTEVASDPVSTFSIDVDSSSYSFVRKLINQGQLPPKGAVRLEEMINYFPYDYALPAKEDDPFRPTVAVYKAPWNPDHKLVHIGIKGYDLETKPKSNLVFLIDTSGSMNSPDKLPLLVSSFKLMLDSLSADDTVSIVTYAGNAGVALEPTKAADKAKIADVLGRLSAGGSTAGAEGIRTAYDLASKNFVKEGNNRVILATDGDFNVGINNPDDLKAFIAQKRTEGVFLSVLGFGQGNYQDATMQALAQNGNGNAAYIDNLSEARKVLVQEAGSTLFTIAKDVKIQVEFNPATVQEYRLIGYETRHLNREDFNNDKIDAGEVGAGHAVTAIYEITPVGATPVSDPLRYGSKPRPEVKTERAEGDGNEYAFLKIRYKRPDADKSNLMTRPITPADDKEFAALPDDLRFAAAVAGFGQLLRGSDYIGSFTYDQAIDIANNARGKDEFGYRSEFVNLARLAKSESGNK